MISSGRGDAASRLSSIAVCIDVGTKGKLTCIVTRRKHKEYIRTTRPPSTHHPPSGGRFVDGPAVGTVVAPIESMLAGLASSQ